MMDIDAVRTRFADRLDNRDRLTYWRTSHAGEDMSAALRRIRDLEDVLAARDREIAQLRAGYDPDLDPPDSCQCHNRAHPPCSFCCP